MVIEASKTLCRTSFNLDQTVQSGRTGPPYACLTNRRYCQCTEISIDHCLARPTHASKGCSNFAHVLDIRRYIRFASAHKMLTFKAGKYRSNDLFEAFCQCFGLGRFVKQIGEHLAWLPVRRRDMMGCHVLRWSMLLVA